MNVSELTYRFCFQQLDEYAIIDFLLANQEELHLDGKQSAKKVTDSLFEHGAVLASFDANNKMVAMLGFFIGDPNNNFADKETLFFYVAAIAREYRVTRLFFVGMKIILTKARYWGLTQFRMQAKFDDPYTNRLYGRMGKPLGLSHTLRGHQVMTYGGSIEELYQRYNRPKKQQMNKVKTYEENDFAHQQFFTAVAS